MTFREVAIAQQYLVLSRDSGLMWWKGGEVIKKERRERGRMMHSSRNISMEGRDIDVGTPLDKVTSTLKVFRFVGAHHHAP
jgi:hypothetical protein